MQKASAKLEEQDIGNHCAVARVELGFIMSAIDVRGHDTLKVTAAYHNSKGEATFVYTWTVT
jgi:hypothetical protein